MRRPRIRAAESCSQLASYQPVPVGNCHIPCLQISIGIGTLAGSSIMLLTVAWAGSVWLGRCDLKKDVRHDIIILIIIIIQGICNCHSMVCCYH